MGEPSGALAAWKASAEEPFSHVCDGPWREHPLAAGAGGSMAGLAHTFILLPSCLFAQGSFVLLFWRVAERNAILCRANSLPESLRCAWSFCVYLQAIRAGEQVGRRMIGQYDHLSSQSCVDTLNRNRYREKGLFLAFVRNLISPRSSIGFSALCTLRVLVRSTSRRFSSVWCAQCAGSTRCWRRWLLFSSAQHVDNISRMEGHFNRYS